MGSTSVRVLHIVSNISIRSGIMSVLMSYYRKLTNRIQFDFIYFDERTETFKKEIEQLGGNVYFISNPKNYLKFKREYDVFCKSKINYYDIVEMHDPFMITFFGNIKEISKIKIMIGHAHNTKFGDSIISNIRNRLLLLTSSYSPDVYFSCTHEAGKAIYGNKFMLEGHIVKNAIDVDLFSASEDVRSEMRKQLRIDGKFVVGHVGNFIKQKNHHFIIKIFGEICKIREDAILLLVGEGMLREEILRECKKMQIEEKVIFLGVRNDVWRVMNCFDCFVFPSFYEGLGIALVEAQAVGIPCVFSDKIPLEVNIINSQNKVMKLQDTALQWAKEIIRIQKTKEILYKEKITDAGYNINEESNKLLLLYEELIDRKS